MSKLGDENIYQHLSSACLTIRQLACLMMAQGLLASEFDDTFEKVADRAVAQADAVLKAEAESREK